MWLLSNILKVEVISLHSPSLVCGTDIEDIHIFLFALQCHSKKKNWKLLDIRIFSKEVFYFFVENARGFFVPRRCFCRDSCRPP